jgi:N-acetyl-gamma-glutamylphosphate reductase
MGREVLKCAQEAGLPLTLEDELASVLVLALPTDVARRRLEGLRGRSVVDLSGAVKQDGTGVYGLDADAMPGRWYGNPGCMAGAVIMGLRRCHAAPTGPLHITAVGGASYAHRDDEGQLRVANRWSSHPHVAEIEAYTRHRVGSFIPMVAYGTKRGLVVTVSAQGSATDGGGSFDIADVVGTSKLAWRATSQNRGFSLAVGVDNLTLPASFAVSLAQRLMGPS